MSTTFETAPDEVVALIRTVTLAYHPDLAECGAKIGAVFAHNADGPAVKVHGAAALACIQPVSAKRRPHCEFDAEIIIDAAEWEKLTKDQQAALIDHELSHLRRKEHSDKQLAKMRKENPDQVAWKVDNLGRPKVGTVPADFTPGDAFAEVIARHGEHAVEFVGAKRFHNFAQKALIERSK